MVKHEDLEGFRSSGLILSLSLSPSETFSLLFEGLAAVAGVRSHGGDEGG